MQTVITKILQIDSNTFSQWLRYLNYSLFSEIEVIISKLIHLFLAIKIDIWLPSILLVRQITENGLSMIKIKHFWKLKVWSMVFKYTLSPIFIYIIIFIMLKQWFDKDFWWCVAKDNANRLCCSLCIPKIGAHAILRPIHNKRPDVRGRFKRLPAESSRFGQDNLVFQN